jgi:hypothetical protein
MTAWQQVYIQTSIGQRKIHETNIRLTWGYFIVFNWTNKFRNKHNQYGNQVFGSKSNKLQIALTKPCVMVRGIYWSVTPGLPNVPCTNPAMPRSARVIYNFFAKRQSHRSAVPYELHSRAIAVNYILPALIPNVRHGPSMGALEISWNP